MEPTIQSAGIIDQVTGEFLQTFQSYAHQISDAAASLFFHLAVIQVTLSFVWMVIQGESLQGLFAKALQMTFLYSFFYGLMQLGGTYIPMILNGFIEVGSSSQITSLSPSSIIDQGVSISGAILKGFFGWGLLSHPFVSFIGAIVCVAVIILYALIAADLAVVLVKAYCLVSVSSLFFAFGGSEITRPMTQNYFKAVIGLGLQLMTMYMLISVASSMGSHWGEMTAEAAKAHELMPMLVILGAVIIYFVMIKNIPPFIAGLSGIGGFRFYGDTAIGTALAVGSNTASALSNISGGAGHALQGATQSVMAAKHMGSSFGMGTQGGNSFMGKAAQGFQAMGQHFASATSNTVKDTFTKTNPEQSFGQKFNQHMKDHLNSAKTS